MIRKTELNKIMNALMIRHWGIFLMDKADKNAPRYFDVENSIFDDVSLEKATVIAIALPYKLELEENRPNFHFGKIEAFAWDFDYHIEVMQRLEALSRMLNLMPETEVRYYVDDSPFNDREVAFHAGLGRIGMNHLLINDALGSQFFIGYLVIKGHLDMDKTCIVQRHELKAELQHPYCKSCNKCVYACPTSVCGNGKSNMLECLSSLTQTKEVIEERFRAMMGDTIYGCSICQKVCPLNKKDIINFVYEPKQSNWIDLFELLRMDRKTFKARYGHMGFAWRSQWVYKRNALIVLGNSGKRAVLDELTRLQEIQEASNLNEYYRWAINKLEISILEESDII